jgi:hypothetical protein
MRLTFPSDVIVHIRSGEITAYLLEYGQESSGRDVQGHNVNNKYDTQ